MMAEYEDFKDVFVTIKYYMSLANLNKNDVGGMSSFMLFHLLYFIYNDLKEKKIKPTRGVAFYEFFKVFGEQWNYDKWAVSCYGKAVREDLSEEETISIISLQDNSDIGRKIKRFAEVKSLFRKVWKILKVAKRMDDVCEIIEDSLDK